MSEEEELGQICELCGEDYDAEVDDDGMFWIYDWLPVDHKCYECRANKNYIGRYGY